MLVQMSIIGPQTVSGPELYQFRNSIGPRTQLYRSQKSTISVPELNYIGSETLSP